jgi:ABC-type uncharacterized transport system ATPase subunit
MTVEILQSGDSEVRHSDLDSFVTFVGGRSINTGEDRLAAKELLVATEILRTEGLWKEYGPVTAVAEMNLRVYEREVFSFLGPNGAGKSTTVGMILGLVRPTRGRVLLFDTDVAIHPWPVMKRVGAVIETPSFYPYLSGYDNLKTLTIAPGRAEGPYRRDARTRRASGTRPRRIQDIFAGHEATARHRIDAAAEP